MSVKTRKQLARNTEQEILDYLETRSEPVSFYKLYTDLNYTSGKAQTALRRMEDRLFIKKKISKMQTFIWSKDFELEQVVIRNRDEEMHIFPISLPSWMGSILRQIPKISEEYSSFMQLVEEALGSFFRDKIPYDLKKQAVLLAVEKGKIPEKLAKQILGE